MPIQDWSMNEASRSTAISILHTYVSIYRRLSSRLAASQEVQLRSSCRMAVRSLVATLRRMDQGLVGIVADHSQTAEQLQQLVEWQGELNVAPATPSVTTQ